MKETVNTDNEDQSGNTESSNLLSETCFHLQTHEAVAVGGVTQPHVADQLVTPDDITEEEESNLNSLWYDDKNEKWKTEISDEGANHLHVIIKPHLEQWSKLSTSPSHIPGKAKYVKAVGIADTGASVLCAGKSIMRRMGVEEKQLCPTTTIIRVANQIKLNVLGMLPVTVQVVGHPDRQTIQALYITQELPELFISRTCLQKLGCLPRSCQQRQLISISISMRSNNWRLLEIQRNFSFHISFQDGKLQEVSSKFIFFFL